MLLLLTVAMAPALKKVVVTGATQGIGLAIVERMLKDFDDVHVYLGARKNGDAAREQILSKLGAAVAPRLDVVSLDVDDEASIRAAAAQVGPVHGVINNAGIGFGRGFEATLRTNFWGTKLVCETFEVTHRIVNIASASGPNFLSRCEDDFDVLAKPQDHSIDEVCAIARRFEQLTDYDNQAYGLSKACVNAYTHMLAKTRPDLLVDSCSPGFILTNLTRGMGATNPPDKGTFAPLFLMFDEAPRTSGRFYGSDAKRSPLDRYRDPGTPPYEGPP